MNIKIMSDYSLALLANCFYADFLFGLFFDPEDGDDICLRNSGCLSPEYAPQYLKRLNYS
jgi:hypothetical protein